MSGKYAADTRVAPSRSRDEIERILTRYGATGFAFAVHGREAMVEFIMRGHRVRLVISLPDPDDREFTHTPERGTRRSAAAARAAREQAVRQRWRALVLIVKAKLEAVASGVVEFDTEFMPYLVLPSGRTVGEAVAPSLTAALQGDEPPSLLPAYDRPSLPTGGRR